MNNCRRGECANCLPFKGFGLDSKSDYHELEPRQRAGGRSDNHVETFPLGQHRQRDLFHEPIILPDPLLFTSKRSRDMKIDVHFGRFGLEVEPSSIPGSEVRIRQTE